MRDDELLSSIESDFEAAGLDDRRLEMLRFARKLTLTPWEMEHRDADALRKVGHSDLDILHIVEVVGYYAYVNRVADGLGVALEEWIPSNA